jgi:hypothetical protein
MTIPYGMLGGGYYGGTPGQGYGIAQAPNVGLQLGQAFAGLGKGIQSVIDPNYDLQKHMQMAIAEHPELGQSLADKAYTSDDPKMLKKMGLGGQVEQQIRGISPSPTAIMAKNIMHKLGPDTTGDIQSQSSKLNPLEQEFLYKHMLGVEDPVDVTQRRNLATAQTATAENTAITSGNTAQLSTAQLPSELIQANKATDYWNNPVTGTEGQDILKQIVTGEEPLTSRAVDAIHFDPNGMGKTIGERIAAMRAARTNNLAEAHLAMEKTNQELSYAREQQTQLKDFTNYGTMATKNESILRDLGGKDPDKAAAAMSSIPEIVTSMGAVRPQLRSQLYNYMKSVNPKWTAQLEAKLEAGTLGRLPPEQFKGLAGFFHDQVASMRAEYQGHLDEVGRSPLPNAAKFMFSAHSLFDPTLTPEMKASAKKDTGYNSYLKAQGYTDKEMQ